MAHVRKIEPGDAHGPITRIYDAAGKRAGSVAQIIQVMSLDAPSADASMQFYARLMKSPNALPADLREMLATVVSGVNGCFY